MNCWHNIYLVRHGESVGNSAKKHFPPEEDVLTENGRMQAELAGKKYSDVPFDYVYCSTILRTKQTAKIILAESKTDAKNMQPVEDKRIQERILGFEKGVTYEEAGMYIAGKLKEGYSFFNMPFPGGESNEEVTARMDSFFKEILQTLKNSGSSKNVLVVTHGFFLCSFMKYLESYDPIISPEDADSKLATKLIRNTCGHHIAVNIQSDVSCKIKYVKLHDNSHLVDCASDSFIVFAKSERALKNFPGCIHA